MAQEYGAAQPIVDYFQKGAKAIKEALESIPTPSRKVDTTWHDKMVTEANEKYRKAAEKKVVKKPAQSTGMSKKPTTSKTYPKKRVAGKR